MYRLFQFLPNFKGKLRLAKILYHNKKEIFTFLINKNIIFTVPNLIENISFELMINGKELEFSDGFTDLHTKIYENILGGGGFGLEENRVAIETVSDIRNANPLGLKGDYHPYLKIIL